MSIIITGDIHAEFSQLNRLINRHRPELVICCGDFGYWPHQNWGSFDDIKPQDSKILWCDGNHEDFWSLRDRKQDEIVPNVFYMPRGSTYTLPDGRVVMFMGGGDSIDKLNRTTGHTWFPEEVITQKDLYDLPDIKIDIMISHTCPKALENTMLEVNKYKYGDPSTLALQQLWEMYKPKLWYFGHWHHYKELELGNTKLYALSTCSYVGYGKWWIKLPEGGS